MLCGTFRQVHYISLLHLVFNRVTLFKFNRGGRQECEEKRKVYYSLLYFATPRFL